MAQSNQSIGATEGGHGSLRLDRGPGLGSRAEILRALSARMSGPGGLYNLGNVISLGAGLSLAVWSTGGVSGLSGATAAMAGYLAGSGSAVALTLATLIFF